MNIDKDDIRENIRYPKNFDLFDNENISNIELMPKGFYKRFIIIATNIVEASITIDTFKFLIDNGKENSVTYDLLRDIENQKIEYISISSQKQRKGRVGRKSSGKVYYNYKKESIKQKSMYKLCDSVDLINIIYNLIERYNSEILINEENDPNLKIQYILQQNEKIKNIYDNQYNIPSVNNTYQIYNSKFINKSLIPEIFNIEYCDSQNRYDISIIKKDKFYIISPNENLIIRDDNLDITSYLNEFLSIFIGYYITNCYFAFWIRFSY